MNLITNPQIKSLLEIGEPKRTRREQALQILGTALEAVEPGAAIRKALRFEPATQILRTGTQEYNLHDFEQVLVIGAGKAGAPMAQAVAEILGERLTGGLVTVKYGYASAEIPARLKLREAGHPVLDQAGLAATSEIIELVQGLTERDLVLTVISGGGSALLEQPVTGVSLADMQTLTQALLKCGATINQLNIIRKHLSQVKGGQLARLCAPAQVISLILSDVVGSPLDIIASGPTVPDSSTFREAWSILQNFGLLEKIPAAIVKHLQRGLNGAIAETPKPGEALFERVQNIIVGDNRLAALAGLEKARELGFNAMLLSTFIEGEAREVANWLAAVAREIATSGNPLPRPACVLLGGETTVTIRGEGKGGRNQELGLAAALAIQGLENVLIVPLATDGSDGPTDAAGAFAEGDTISRAASSGLNALDFLQRNDAYNFFEKTGALLKTGPTNTNVNDLTLLLVF